MSTIDISDINLVELITALWRKQIVASFFQSFDARRAGLSPPRQPSEDDILKSLNSQYKYIDYLAGRAIKTDFSDLQHVNTALYNRDAGAGVFEAIVDYLRKKE